MAGQIKIGLLAASQSHCLFCSQASILALQSAGRFHQHCIFVNMLQLQQTHFVSFEMPLLLPCVK